MEVQLFITILTFSLPVFSGLICFGIVCPWRGTSFAAADRKVQRVLAVYFLTAAFGWFSMLVYPLFPIFATCIQSFIYLSFLLIQVIFYNFVFLITKFDPAQQFSRLHYLFPALICGTLLGWSFFVPFEVQLYLIENKGEPAPGYELYSKLFLSKIAGRLTFSFVYTILSLIRILRYRKGVADFSANESRSSLCWVNILIAISFCFLLMPILAIYAGRIAIYSSLVTVFTALLVATQHVILTYNTIKGNYVIAGENIEGNKRLCGNGSDYVKLADGTSLFKKFDPESFTKIMHDRKPYLDPDLKITDLAELFGTNRTYVSSFINTTYRMNFSRYINTLRLEELERIRNSPLSCGLPLTQQIAMAGFGSYRNYKRFKGK